MPNTSVVCAASDIRSVVMNDWQHAYLPPLSDQPPSAEALGPVPRKSGGRQRRNRRLALRSAREAVEQETQQAVEEVVVQEEEMEASGGGLEPHSVAPPPSKETAAIFRADVFAQCFRLHMTLYTVCAALTANMMIFLPGECQTDVLFFLATLFALFVGGAAMRMYSRVYRTGRWKQTRAAERVLDSGQKASHLVLPAKANAYFMLLAWPAFIATFLSQLVFDGFAGVNATAICGHPWDAFLPLWFAHVGVIEVLMGVLLATFGIPLRRILIRGSVVHLLCALQVLGYGNSKPLAFCLACHVVQHVAFFSGVYVGDTLLHGQRRYFDQAAALRIHLLERRIEQLKGEKERVTYDRSMLEHELAEYHRHCGTLSSSGASSSHSHSTGQPDRSRGQIRTEATGQGPPDATSAAAAEAAERHAAAAAAGVTPSAGAIGLRPGLTLPAEPQPALRRRQPPSSSGWSKLNSMIKEEVAQGFAGPADGEAMPLRSGSSALNPNAPAWNG